MQVNSLTAHVLLSYCCVLARTFSHHARCRRKTPCTRRQGKSARDQPPRRRSKRRPLMSSVDTMTSTQRCERDASFQPRIKRITNLKDSEFFYYRIHQLFIDISSEQTPDLNCMGDTSTYPIMRLPSKKEKRMKKQIVDGVEEEVEVEIIIDGPLERLFPLRP
ncbi:hypothetical protein BYT27DRAFT_6442017 [Phlegmacium glaucopus]|nr:hypothetical protein BYT27DRAFT_6442017 [Phlegmacium glaucopus]